MTTFEGKPPSVVRPRFPVSGFPKTSGPGKVVGGALETVPGFPGNASGCWFFQGTASGCWVAFAGVWDRVPGARGWRSAMGTSGLQGVCSSPPNVLGVSGGNCITAPIAPKTCERSSLATDLGGGSPVGAYRSDDTPGIYRSKGECRAYRANSVLYCTISHDAVRYYATPCYAIHTTLRRAYHAMPQCHTILHNVPPAPWCPARILRASSHAYGDSGSGSGSGVWHAGLAVPAATRREPRVPPDITRSLNPSLRA